MDIDYLHHKVRRKEKFRSDLRFSSVIRWTGIGLAVLGVLTLQLFPMMAGGIMFGMGYFGNKYINHRRSYLNSLAEEEGYC